VLRWVREHGCDWDEETCSEAAAGGHLEVLTWVREHGCPWVEVDEGDGEYTMNCCTCAVSGGHLEVLHGFGSRTARGTRGPCASAAYGGHLEVLKWAGARKPMCGGGRG